MKPIQIMSPLNISIYVCRTSHVNCFNTNSKLNYRVGVSTFLNM